MSCLWAVLKVYCSSLAKRPLGHRDPLISTFVLPLPKEGVFSGPPMYDLALRSALGRAYEE
jgi:hypothetical protein